MYEKNERQQILIKIKHKRLSNGKKIFMAITNPIVWDPEF